MERFPISWIGRINIIKMVIFPKAICRFSAIQIKIPMTVLIEIEKAIMKFIWKNKSRRVAKVILGRKSDVGYITIADLKLYFRAIVTKITWYWHRNRHVDQWYRIEDTEANQQKYSNLILDKGSKNIQWRKDSLFNKWCWENWKSMCSRLKLNPYFSPRTKVNSKWIKDLGITPETLHILKEKVGPNFQLLGLGLDFLNGFPLHKK